MCCGNWAWSPQESWLVIGLPRFARDCLLLLLLVRGLNILAGQVSVGFQGFLRILQGEAEVRSLLLRLRVGLGRRLQGPEFEIEARVGFNQLFQALVILLHRLLVELAAFILIKVV